MTDRSQKRGLLAKLRTAGAGENDLTELFCVRSIGPLRRWCSGRFSSPDDAENAARRMLDTFCERLASYPSDEDELFDVWLASVSRRVAEETAHAANHHFDAAGDDGDLVVDGEELMARLYRDFVRERLIADLLSDPLLPLSPQEATVLRTLLGDDDLAATAASLSMSMGRLYAMRLQVRSKLSDRIHQRLPSYPGLTFEDVIPD